MAADMPGFDLLRLFVAVADHGKIAGAAAALNLSPSFVSRRLAELEAQLGGRLFLRTTRSLKLTDSGIVALDWARAACADYENVRNRIAASGGGRSLRPIRVAAADTIIDRYIAPAVAAFQSVHRDTRVRIATLGSIGELKDMQNDLVIHTGDLPPGAWTARKLGSYTRHLYASESYLEEFGRPAVPADLVRHRCISYSLTEAADAWHFERAGVLHSQPVRPYLETSNTRMWAEAITRGVGIARMSPATYAALGFTPAVVRIMIDYCVVNSSAQHPGFWLLTAQQRLPAHVQAFVDLVVERISADRSRYSSPAGPPIAIARA